MSPVFVNLSPLFPRHDGQGYPSHCQVEDYSLAESFSPRHPLAPELPYGRCAPEGAAAQDSAFGVPPRGCCLAASRGIAQINTSRRSLLILTALPVYKVTTWPDLEVRTFPKQSPSRFPQTHKDKSRKKACPLSLRWDLMPGGKHTQTSFCSADC